MSAVTNRRPLDLVFVIDPIVRTDPPVDAAYLRGTFLLDLVHRRRTLMINAPACVRHANEKLFCLQFPELCPPTMVSSSVTEIIETVRAWGSAVVKPTDGLAGRGIMLLRAGDPNVRSILEVATTRGRDQVVIQRFRPSRWCRATAA